jgi:hypothetical protein
MRGASKQHWGLRAPIPIKSDSFLLQRLPRTWVFVFMPECRAAKRRFVATPPIPEKVAEIVQKVP